MILSEIFWDEELSYYLHTDSCSHIFFYCYHNVLAINSVNHVILLTMKAAELYDVTTELSSILFTSITRGNFFVKVIILFAGQALIIVVI